MFREGGLVPPNVRYARIVFLRSVFAMLNFESYPDELIRQVTLNAPERGLLLLRVRDEARMTADAYQTLYDSSVTFGIRKQVSLGRPGPY
jgi:hypothetical protein